MKAFMDLAEIFPGWIWALICAGAFAFAGVTVWRLDESHKQIKDMRLQQAEAVAAAEKAAREETDRLQGVKDAAIAEAEKRAATNAAAAGRAQSELARLRNLLSKIPADSADPACKAAADRAAAIGELLGTCSERYTDVAGKADAHASDLRTFYDAWPANADFQKRLDAFTQQLKGNRP